MALRYVTGNVARSRYDHVTSDVTCCYGVTGHFVMSVRIERFLALKNGKHPFDPRDYLTQLDRCLALGLALQKDGRALGNLDNVATIFERDVAFRGKLQWDRREQVFVTGDPPHRWNRVDSTMAIIYFQRTYDMGKVGRGSIDGAMERLQMNGDIPEVPVPVGQIRPARPRPFAWVRR